MFRVKTPTWEGAIYATASLRPDLVVYGSQWASLPIELLRLSFPFFIKSYLLPLSSTYWVSILDGRLLVAADLA